MDLMDESPDRSARQRVIGIYLEFSYHLARVRRRTASAVLRSRPVERTISSLGRGDLR